MEEHTPHSTANMLEITPVTLRRWCAAHAVYLSPLANPPERGEARRFTGRDIEVLKHIKSLRAHGLTEKKINEQLRTLTFAEIETATDVAPESNLAVQESLSHAPAPLVMVEATQAMQALQAQIQAIQQAQRAGWWWLVAGIVIGLGLAVVFELAAIVASR